MGLFAMTKRPSLTWNTSVESHDICGVSLQWDLTE
jgi:hypothetical protein